MTIKDALLKSSSLKNSTSPHLDAEVLLSFILNKPKEFLFTYPEKTLSKSAATKYLSLIKKRQTGWPVAYLTGEKFFAGLKFRVTKDTLIPRPRTEELVILAVHTLKDQPGLSILDVGTGSGTIIVALAKLMGPKNKYFASDVSERALAVARLNARTQKVKISFKQSNLMEKWPQQFDVICANLPYLKSKDDPSIQREPTLALVSKHNGMYHYEQLFKQLALNPPKYLFLEADPKQIGALKKLAKLIPQTTVEIITKP